MSETEQREADLRSDMARLKGPPWGLYSDIRFLLSQLDEARGRIRELEEALREIAKGEGAFSLDPLTHAANIINSNIATAERALAASTPAHDSETTNE